MDFNKVKKHIKNKNIELRGIREHSKASEAYIDIKFHFPSDQFTYSGSIPFHYRRTGKNIEKEDELAKYIESIYLFFKNKAIKEWAKMEKDRWEKEHSNKRVTKPFFDKLLNLKWNCANCELPNNPNFARRIQYIKEMGYTLATNTNFFCENCNKATTHHMLIPIPIEQATGYEIMSPKLKKRIIKALNSINVYENKKTASVKRLIPDHKFPEIRWDKNTKEENLEEMNDKDIKEKFQLVENQRNLQKREVCRTCFHTSKRGLLFGIKYFYKGNASWPKKVPKTGKKAEKGCVGCGWYDMQAWRESLNNKLKSKKN